MELMLKMGYKPGDGLGSNADGKSSPISVTVKSNRAGIGAERAFMEGETHAEEVGEQKIRPASCPGTAFRHVHWRDVVELHELTKSLDDALLLDPLRPRCRYDRSHTVRNLKALKKHEAKCPARTETQSEAKSDSNGS